MASKGIGFLAVALTALSILAAGPASAGIVYQGLGQSFVATEAESAAVVINSGTKSWLVVDGTPTLTSPVSLPVMPATNNASGGQALLTDFGMAGYASTASWQFKFASAGTYRLYVRYSLFESGVTPANYGNEDSFYRPSDFDVLPPTDGTNIVSGFNTPNVEGTFGWLNTTYDYTVDAADVGATSTAFRIYNREAGLSLDRVLFSKTNNLNSSQLDALANGSTAVSATHFTNGTASGAWETAGNWDNGVPAAGVVAYVGAGLAATVSQAGQVAQRLQVGSNETADAGNGTVAQTGGTLTVTELLHIGPEARTGSYSATGGALTVGQAATGRADLFIARRGINTASNTVGTLDLSGASSFNAYLDRLMIAWQTADSSGGTGGSVTGTLKLAASNTIDANQITVGYIDSGNISTTTGTINLGAANNIQTDVFTIGADKSAGTVNFSAANSQLTLGATGRRTDLRVGYKAAGTSANSSGTLDLSNGTVTAYLSELSIGRSMASSTGKPTGTVTLGSSASNVVDISGNLVMAPMSGDVATFSMSGGSVTVGGGLVGGAGAGTLTVNEGTMTVASGLSVDTLTVGVMDSNGGTAKLAVNGGAVAIGSGTETMILGRRSVGLTNPPTPNMKGTADFAGASGVAINVNQLLLGTISGAPSGEGTVQGELILSAAGSNAITADSILVGDSSDRGNGVLNTIQLGGAQNAINANTVTLGARKGQGSVTIRPGGTLTLQGKTAGTQADLDLAINANGTGVVGIGTLDITGGTLHATLDAVRLGSQSGGSGSATGTLTFDAGTVTANSIAMGIGDRATGKLTQRGGTMTVSGNITDGGGTSELRIEGGTFNAGGNLAADKLVVGLDGRNATVNLTGATVALGSASNRVNAFIGRRESNTAASFLGTLDASQVGTLTAYFNELNIATMASGVGASQGAARGLVKLGASNIINANTIRISDSPEVGMGGNTNSLILGADNTIAATTIIVGGNKSDAATGGTIQFPTGGGKLLLGSASARPAISVGLQTVGTGGGAAGLIDLSGASADSRIYAGQLLIGSKPDAAVGTTKGVVTMNGGTMDVTSMILGRRADAGNAGIIRGTFNLNGGTLIAGSIEKGSGNGNNTSDQANFFFNAGRLAVTTFGSSAAPFKLNNTGAGTLAPGNSIGTTTVWGDYAQGANAALEIELDGALSDLLTVNGSVSLGGQLLLPILTSVAEGNSYLILANDGSDPIGGTFAGLTEGSSFYSPDNSTLAFTITYVGGTGNDVVLTAVPEPATMGLLALAATGLGGYIRRRRR